MMQLHSQRFIPFRLFLSYLVLAIGRTMQIPLCKDLKRPLPALLQNNINCKVVLQLKSIT